MTMGMERSVDANGEDDLNQLLRKEKKESDEQRKTSSIAITSDDPPHQGAATSGSNSGDHLEETFQEEGKKRQSVVLDLSESDLSPNNKDKN